MDGRALAVTALGPWAAGVFSRDSKVDTDLSEERCAGGRKLLKDVVFFFSYICPKQ